MTLQSQTQKPGFTKSKLASLIDVEVSFPSLYKDDGGAPLVFTFPLRMELESDSDALQMKFAGRVVPLHEQRLERLVRLLVAEPRGFDDFAAGGNLQQAARDYFSGEAMAHIVRGCLNLYDRAVTPAELFR